MASKPKQCDQASQKELYIGALYDRLRQVNPTTLSFAQICKDITLANVQFSQHFADQFMATIMYGGHVYYNQSNIFSNESTLSAIGSIYSANDVRFTDDNLLKLLAINTGYMLLEKYISIGKQFNENQTELIFKKISDQTSFWKYDNYYNGDPTKDSYVKLIDKHCDAFFCSDSTLILASISKLHGFITRAINNKYNIPQQCLNGIIQSKNLELTKLVLLSGCKLNTDALVSACSTCDIELIKFVLNNKVVPTKKCFDAIVEASDNNPQYMARSEKKNIEKKIISKKSMCIDELKTYGYKITYDDVVSATKKRIMINNFASLGIKLDNKFMEICSDVSFYPYKVDGLKPTTTCLQNECKKAGNLTIIKDLVKRGIKPDIQCLRHACKHKSNIQTIKFLIEKGNLIPDIECLKSIISTISNRTLTYIGDLYTKSVTTSKQYNELKKLDEPNVSNSDDEPNVSNLDDEPNVSNSDDEPNVNDLNNKKSDNSDNDQKFINNDKKPVKKNTVVEKKAINNKKQIKVVLSDTESD
jgi:hypothetical protein